MEHSVEEIILKNGVKGLLINVPGSQVVRTQIIFKSGYLFSSAEKYEMPHVTEHLLISGNEDYPDSNDFKQEIEKNGAFFNAYTSIDFNWYVWECAEFEIERILDLATSQLTKPLISEKDVTTEKSRVKEELEGNMSDHQRTVWNNLVASAKGEPNYQTRVNQLPTITASDMRSYYERTHTRQNAYFFIAGNLSNKENILKKIEGLTNNLPQGKNLVIPSRPTASLEKPVVEKRDIKQIYYVNHFASGTLDLKQLSRLSLLRDMLNSFMPSSLFGSVWKSGLAYGISSTYNYSNLETEVDIYYRVTPENAADLFNLIAEKLKQIVVGDFDKTDVEAAKNIAKGHLVIGNQTLGRLLNFYVNDYVYFNKYLNLEEWLDLKQAVTKDEMVEIAQMTIKEAVRVTSFVGNIDDPMSQKLHDSLNKVSKL